jgi:hypothetical protein
MAGARDSDEGAAREGDAHSLPLVSVDAVVPERTTGDALRRDHGGGSLRELDGAWPVVDSCSHGYASLPDDLHDRPFGGVYVTEEGR